MLGREDTTNKACVALHSYQTLHTSVLSFDLPEYSFTFQRTQGYSLEKPGACHIKIQVQLEQFLEMSSIFPSA